MAEQDHYRTLGIKKSASAADLKKAYRRLARKFHPDVNPGDSAAEDRFKEIQNAYQILSDPKKRKMYDRFGVYREGMQAQPGGAGPAGADPSHFEGFDFSGHGAGRSSFRDIFSDLFGGAAGRTGRPEPGADLEYAISVSFLDAIKGTEARINVTRKVACGRCKGSGSISGTASVPCSECGGSGTVQQNRGPLRFSSTCPACGGSGKRRAGDCPDCGGDGLIRKTDSIKVRIPAGVQDGSRVRLAGKGDAGPFNGPVGDLFLRVRVEPHPFFSRQGRDIHCRVPLTFSEAVLGTGIEVPTIDGKAKLKIPPGTQSGQKLRLRGRGVPAGKKGAAGDQLVEVRVVVPRVRDQRSKEILREFAQLNPENPRSELAV